MEDLEPPVRIGGRPGAWCTRASGRYSDGVMAAPTPRLRPEDATSYEEFADRIGAERASFLSWQFSRRATLLWAGAYLPCCLGWILLMAAIRSFPAALWAWPAAVILLGVGAGSAVVLIRRSRRERRRSRELDRMTGEWRDHALHGQVQLSRSGRPEDEREWATRLRFRIKVDEAAVGPAPHRRRRSTVLMTAAASSMWATAPLFPLLVTAGLFGAPGSIAIPLLALLLGLLLAGGVLLAIGGWRALREQAQMRARMEQAQAEARARVRAGLDP